MAKQTHRRLAAGGCFWHTFPECLSTVGFSCWLHCKCSYRSINHSDVVRVRAGSHKFGVKVHQHDGFVPCDCKTFVQNSEAPTLWFSGSDTKSLCLLFVLQRWKIFCYQTLLCHSYADVTSSVEVFLFIRLQTVARCPSERGIFWLTYQSASSQSFHKEAGSDFWLKLPHK